mmetsp:Transcript_6807/g.7834  ORF Transcript_6807/g.7834 Transcript_6807/m.7834 type:complete len:98 (+) Transcript_6807:813-1106(+)
MDVYTSMLARLCPIHFFIVLFLHRINNSMAIMAIIGPKQLKRQTATQCQSRLIAGVLFAHNRPRPILAIEFFQESTRRIQTTDMMDDAINILLLIFL